MRREMALTRARKMLDYTRTRVWSKELACPNSCEGFKWEKAQNCSASTFHLASKNVRVKKWEKRSKKVFQRKKFKKHEREGNCRRSRVRAQLPPPLRCLCRTHRPAYLSFFCPTHLNHHPFSAVPPPPSTQSPHPPLPPCPFPPPPLPPFSNSNSSWVTLQPPPSCPSARSPSNQLSKSPSLNFPRNLQQQQHPPTSSPSSPSAPPARASLKYPRHRSFAPFSSRRRLPERTCLRLAGCMGRRRCRRSSSLG